MWFRRKRPTPAPGDWVTVPYRIVEACRLSLYTIGAHPDIPEHVRFWIAQWLAGYNSALALWFQENYGPDIFGVLAAISDEVRNASEQANTREHEQAMHDAFQRWERELSEGEEK